MLVAVATVAASLRPAVARAVPAFPTIVALNIRYHFALTATLLANWRFSRFLPTCSAVSLSMRHDSCLLAISAIILLTRLLKLS
ncbi:hypothetical protein Plhal304r1_c017g0063231 [Plasmopara halstedii]